jgi:hypothetical protein
MKKKKITVYADVFAHKLDKLKHKIKKARKEKLLSREYTKQLIKEAKQLRSMLKDLADD